MFRMLLFSFGELYDRIDASFFLRKIDLMLAQHIITHISDQMEYAQSFQYYVGKLFTSYAWRNGFVWIKPFNNATF